MSFPTDIQPSDPADRLTRRFPKPLAQLFLELFVAVALTVNFFYLVRPLCQPNRAGDTFNLLTFCRFSKLAKVPFESTQMAWQTRIVAPMMSSWLADLVIQEPVKPSASRYHSILDVARSPEFQDAFGLYHSVWLFLLFLALIAFRQDALLLILGTFAGLMGNLIEPAGAGYYPWDMPALLFFTLACLLFDKGRIGLLLPVIVLGSLLKETVLCCSLFVLLGSHWNWPKRIAGFLGVAGAALALNHLLVLHHDVNALALPMNGARRLTDLFQNTLLVSNIKVLFSVSHVLFANAGALLLMMLIPWRNRRDILFKLVILVFAIGQFLYGAITEVRIWYEILPLGWMLVSAAVSRQWSDRQNPAGPADFVRDFLQTIYWLLLGFGLAAAIVVLVIARLNPTPAEKEIQSFERALPETITAAEKGDVSAQHKLGDYHVKTHAYEKAIRWYTEAAKNGDVHAAINLGSLLGHVRQDHAGAVFWYQKAADQGNPLGKTCLARMYASGLGCERDPQAAFRLYTEAATQGEPTAQMELGGICQRMRPPNLIEAYMWLKLSVLQGNDVAVEYLRKCSAKMTPEHIAFAERLVEQFVEAQKEKDQAGH